MGDRSPFRAGFLKVELFLGGVWVDVSADLGEDGVSITRGRADETSQPDASSCTLTLDNTGGKYCPRNPASVYYGKLTRNTPVRVTVQPTSPVSAVYNRFHGFVVEWPQRWTKRGTCYAPIVCAGAMRRLGQGAPALRSPLYRRLSTIGSHLLGYWPCEEQDDGATRFASGLPGGRPSSSIIGTPFGFGQFTGYKGSEPLPMLGTASFAVRVPAKGTSGVLQLRWLTALPVSTLDQAVLLRVACDSGLRIDLRYDAANDGVDIEAWDGSTSKGTTAVLMGVSGNNRLRMSLELQQSGGSVNWTLAWYVLGGGVAFVAGTWATTTLTRGARVTVNPDGEDLAGIPIGHITAEDAITSLFAVSSDVMSGYAGEAAAQRFARLCGEEGLSSTPWYDLSQVEDMTKLGPQPLGDVLSILRDAATADGGFLFEPVDGNALAFRSLEQIVSQPPQITIPYTDNLLRPFEPTDDDQALRNLVTATRDGGSSATVEDATGPLGTAAVGTYSDDVTLSLNSDDQCESQAAWRVHLGTVDEPRWPQIGLDLADLTFWDSTRRGQILNLELGDMVRITGLPSWLPPDAVEAIVQGYTETITPLHWEIVWTTTPASPYRLATYDDTGSVWGGDAEDGTPTVLAEDLTTTEAGVDVTPPAGVEWSWEANFGITVGGEVMTVTAISALSGGTQTFTVTRSVNGVVKTHLTGATVALAVPTYYGL